MKYKSNERSFAYLTVYSLSWISQNHHQRERFNMADVSPVLNEFLRCLVQHLLVDHES
jgi:hypothetical protein